MPSSKDTDLEAVDPLLSQAEKIFLQRQARALVIDPDLLGEPAWDILLCAFIAYRKGTVCKQDEIAEEINISLSVASRWVSLLSTRGMLVQKGDFFVISEETEHRLSAMFKAQINDVLEAFEALENERSWSAAERRNG
jgi:hypothetical protein